MAPPSSNPRAALWDSARVIPTHHGTPLPTQAAALQKQRSAPFEAALVADTGDDRQLSALRAAYEQRARRWCEIHRSIWKDYDAVQLIKGTLALGSAGSTAAFTTIPFAYLWAAIKRPLGLGTYAKLRRGVEDRICPHCGYDLRFGARSGATWRHRVISIAGPPACPECAEPWPLLPPEI